MTASWTCVFPTGPPALLPRSSHAISEIGGKVYAWGGENVARTPIDTNLFVCEPLAKPPVEWELVAAKGVPPCPRVAHSQAVVGSCIYLFGGRQGIHMDEAPLNDMHRFDVSSGTWEAVESKAGTPPCPRSFHRMVAVGTSLYVFGGCGADGRMSDLHQFNTVTREWHALPASDAIKGRGGACFFSHEGTGKLFVVAGFAGEETNDCHVYDISTKSWRQIPLEIRPRSVCGCATVGDLLVIFGGEVDPSEKGHEGAGAFANDVVAISAVTETLVPLSVTSAELPQERGWTACTALGPGLCLFAGLTGSDEAPTRLADTWLLSLAQ